MEGPHLNFERCAFSPLTFGTPSSSDTIGGRGTRNGSDGMVKNDAKSRSKALDFACEAVVNLEDQQG